MARTGRPREFDEDAAVAQAMQLFWKRGYTATSIQDLVDSLGVQRGSLYAAFGNKQALLLRALSCYSGIVTPALAGLAGDGAVLPHLREYLSGSLRHLAHHDAQGCLLGNTSVEISAGDTAIADAIRTGFDALEATISSALERAYDKGELPRRDARAQARMLIAVEQGLEIMSRTTRDAQSLNSAVEATLNGLH
jgi:TetR/AcrR family transcriptional repressor of nem operon